MMKNFEHPQDSSGRARKKKGERSKIPVSLVKSFGQSFAKYSVDLDGRGYCS